MFPKVYKLKFNRLAGYHFSAGLRTDTTARINASMPVEDTVEHGATAYTLLKLRLTRALNGLLHPLHEEACQLPTIAHPHPHAFRLVHLVVSP